MKRIEIDFSGHVPWLQKLGWMVLACGIAACALTSWRYVVLSRELKQAQEMRQFLLAQWEERSTSVGQKQDEGVLQRGAQGTSVAIPWDELLSSLEQAAGEDIALLELEPDAENKEVRLVGEARNLDALLIYLRRLQQTPAIGELRRLTHREKIEDPQRPVHFELSAVWRWQSQ